MKVLIISHNCFSTTQSMGKTFASLFSEFEKSELMQLYLYPTLPNTDQCTNLFRITDHDVMDSILHRNYCCGRPIQPHEIKLENKLYQDISASEAYKRPRKNDLLARRARDVMWMLGNWKSEELKAWLNEGRPDVVFYALGDAVFSQNIAMWAANYLNIPLVTYVCDEFYYYHRNLHGFFARAISVPLVKNIEKTIKSSVHLITICKEQGEAYKKTFGVPYTTIMTGSSFPAGSLAVESDSNQISYIGNLALNRWKSIQEIASTIQRINKEQNENFRLVYYGTENEHLSGYAEFGGRLSHEEIQTVMSRSRLLIHTESFEEKFRDRLRYSVSTKVADSLASGNCLFAYGPEELASFHYLKKNECAFVCGDEEKLYGVMADALTNKYERNRISANAVHVAEKNHNSKLNSKKLKEVMERI